MGRTPVATGVPQQEQQTTRGRLQGFQLTVHFLGTGGGWPTVERNVPSVAVHRGSEVLLFDCGEGTQRQLQRSALSYMDVSAIFVSHHHGDHVFGLPGLLRTMNLMERAKPLLIVGGRTIRRVLDGMMQMSPFTPVYPIEVRELAPGESMAFDGYRVEAAKGIHGAPNNAYALIEEDRPGRFNKPRALELGVPEGPMFRKLQLGENVTLKDGRTVRPEDVLGGTRPGRKIVVSGDTRPSPDVVALARGADLLLHEATYLEADKDKAVENGHSTAREAAEVAKAANVKELWLYHLSPRVMRGEDSLREAREVFPNTKVASDFATVDVALAP